VKNIAISRDGKILAAALSNVNIEIWSPKKLNHLYRINGLINPRNAMTKKIKSENMRSKLFEYEKMAKIASEQEKRASDAERASIKYKQVEYMSLRKGQIFDGVISGVTEWGIYVEEMETKCEGMIRVKDMSDDFYIFNEKKLELVGQKKKRRYRLGDRVKIKVEEVDLEKKTIDYALV
jgi:exoribonuclease R